MKVQSVVVGSLFAGMFMAACSGSPTGPTGTAGGGALRPQASTADNAPTGNPAISRPNDAPSGFTFVLQGQQHEDYRQSAFVAWTPVVNVGKYEVQFERFNSSNDVNAWESLPTLFVNSPTKFQIVLPHGQVRARVRSVHDGGQGNWTAFLGVAIPLPPPPADAIDVDDCIIEELGPSDYEFVY